MKWSIVITAVCALLVGCGERLSGRYELQPSVPKLNLPTVDPKTQKALIAQMGAVQDLHKMTLEFKGSKVRMSNAAVTKECPYRIEGNELKIMLEHGGNEYVMPMILEEDGSISYLGMRYRKVD